MKTFGFLTEDSEISEDGLERGGGDGLGFGVGLGVNGSGVVDPRVGCVDEMDFDIPALAAGVGICMLCLVVISFITHFLVLRFVPEKVES